MRHQSIRRLLNRYLSFAAARIALVLGRWFILILAARQLPTADFAALGAVLSLAEILRATADLGVDGFTYSRLGSSRARLRPTVSAALQLRIAASVIATGAGCALFLLISPHASALPVFALVLCGTTQSTTTALLQKAVAFRALTFLVVITLAASVTVDAIALTTQLSLGVAAMLLVIPDITAAATATILAMRVATPSKHPNPRRRTIWRSLKPIVGKLAPGALVSVMVVAYSRLDVVLVLPVAGVHEQADYSAGFRLMEPLFLFFAIASLALLAELGSGPSTQARGMGNRLLRVNAVYLLLALSTVGALAAPISGWSAEHLIGLTAGSASVAAIFTIALPFRLANSMMTTLLQRLGRFDLVMIATILNGALTFACAIAMTIRFGAPGAAAAALIGEFVNTIYQRSMLSRLMQQRS